uniref:Uncharacterized protein n=1 Tax=Oryza brachyantha TaxID=4533 RepID=J3NDE3_ORYBR
MPLSTVSFLSSLDGIIDVVIEIFYQKHLDYLVDLIASSRPPRNISRAYLGLDNTYLRLRHVVKNRVTE